MHFLKFFSETIKEEKYITNLKYLIIIFLLYLSLFIY